MVLYVANATGWSLDSLLDLPLSELWAYSELVRERKLYRIPFA